MANLVLPRVQAMVLCDDIEESDLEDAVFTLTHVRSAIESASFPTFYPQLCVFVQMSGHRGQSTCHIEIERIETDEVVFETEPKVFEFEEPGRLVPDYFRLFNCGFAVPGLYYVQIYADGKLIGERPLHVQMSE